MEYEGRRESDNVEDRRGTGMPVRGMAVGGGIGSILLVVLALALGIDPRVILGPGGQGGPGGPPGANGPVERDPNAPVDPAEEQAKKFVSVVLADTEDVWHALFPKEFGKQYRDPKLVLFSGQVQSGCGVAGAAMGPFYCPADDKVYLDLSFLGELRDRFQAPGDFAAAYVVAHEVGHHVQNQLGISDRVHQQRERLNEAEYNKLSVRLELQADFLAGVWAHHAQKSKHILEPGDLEEAFGAAKAVGDDRLQKQARGRVVPDSFTHGTSAQRVRWFKRGFDTGDVHIMDELFELPQSQL